MPFLSSMAGGSARGYGFGSKKAAVAATGGTETTVNGYKYHKFTSTSNFVVAAGGKVDYMILGGGYTGLNYGASAGGGAAGAYVEEIDATIGTGTMLVTVGGSDTVSSVAFVTRGTVTATGRQGYGQSGNSNLTAPTGLGIYYGGGAGQGVYGGGGGAGMGGDGGGAPGGIDTNLAGSGGPGIQRTTYATATSSGVSNYYGGGGGGGGGYESRPGGAYGSFGAGGSGGGGQGGNSYGGGSLSGGAANTGSGGGGNNNAGASGGSGIVIIRYAV